MATIDLAEFDTTAVRAAVSKIRKCASALSEGTRPRIQTISSGIQANLEGETATALENRVGDLRADVNTLVGSMNGLCNALSKYADNLERMAQELKKQLS